MDDFGLLVGRHFTALPTLIDEQLSELQLDDKGRLIIAGRFLEDSAHVSTDPGLFILTVRNDGGGTLVDTDGDYAPLQVDAQGRLRVAVDAQGTEAYNATDNLAAAADGLITGIGGTYTDIVEVAVGAGETAYVYGWQWDSDKNGDGRLVTDDTTDVIVYKVRMNSSAMPGIGEHWDEGGRIEIAGAADLKIKIQVRKRGAGGGNASASGSLHVRIV